jgi:nitrogen regulatory protein P-II 1
MRVSTRTEVEEMKMVVAYIERESFESIREELLGLGFSSISAWEASGSVPEPTVRATYRGTRIENHLRPKTRLECVVGDEQVPTVVDSVLRHATERRFVFVVAVEQAYPTDTVKSDETVTAAVG